MSDFLPYPELMAGAQPFLDTELDNPLHYSHRYAIYYSPIGTQPAVVFSLLIDCFL